MLLRSVARGMRASGGGGVSGGAGNAPGAGEVLELTLLSGGKRGTAGQVRVSVRGTQAQVQAQGQAVPQEVAEMYVPQTAAGTIMLGALLGGVAITGVAQASPVLCQPAEVPRGLDIAPPLRSPPTDDSIVAMPSTGHGRGGGGAPPKRAPVDVEAPLRCAGRGGGRATDAGASSSQSEGSGSDSMDQLIDSIAPMAAELGYGGVLGFSAGYATKRVGKEIAALIGVAFIALQAMQYFGYVNISWRKVQSDVTASLDVDGDGKLTPNDAKVAWRKLQDVLSYNLPASSGFGTGFAMGLYLA